MPGSNFGANIGLSLEAAMQETTGATPATAIMASEEAMTEEQAVAAERARWQSELKAVIETAPDSEHAQEVHGTPEAEAAPDAVTALIGALNAELGVAIPKEQQAQGPVSKPVGDLFIAAHMLGEFGRKTTRADRGEPEMRIVQVRAGNRAYQYETYRVFWRPVPVLQGGNLIIGQQGRNRLPFGWQLGVKVQCTCPKCGHSKASFLDHIRGEEVRSGKPYACRKCSTKYGKQAEVVSTFPEDGHVAMFQSAGDPELRRILDIRGSATPLILPRVFGAFKASHRMPSDALQGWSPRDSRAADLQETFAQKGYRILPIGEVLQEQAAAVAAKRASGLVSLVLESPAGWMAGWTNQLPWKMPDAQPRARRQQDRTVTSDLGV